MLYAVAGGNAFFVVEINLHIKAHINVLEDIESIRLYGKKSKAIAANNKLSHLPMRKALLGRVVLTFGTNIIFAQITTNGKI